MIVRVSIVILSAASGAAIAIATNRAELPPDPGNDATTALSAHGDEPHSPGSLRRALARPDGDFTTVIAALAGHDLAGVISIARENPVWEPKVFYALRNIAWDDPIEAEIVYLDRNLDPDAVASALQALMINDTETAVLAVRDGSPDAAVRLIQMLGNADPTAGLRLAGETLDRRDFMRAAQSIFDTWATEDPAASWEALGSLPEDADLGSLQNSILETWFEQDPDAAEALVSRAGFEPAPEAVEMIIGGLAVRNYDKAVSWTRRYRDTPRGLQHFSTLFRKLGEKDPELGIASIAAGLHLESNRPSDAVRDFATKFFANHPEGAMEWIQGYNGIGRIDAIERIVHDSQGLDPERRFEFVESLGLPPGKLLELDGDFTALASTDLPRFLALFKNAPEEVGGKAIMSAAESLAETGNFGEALELVNSVPETEQDPRFVGAIVTPWLERDPAGAAAYAESLPPGPALQEASAALARHFADSDPVRVLNHIRAFVDNPKLTSEFLNSESASSLIAQAPAKLRSLFPENAALHARIENDHAFRAYLRDGGR